MAAKTRFGLEGYGVRRAGSFASKTQTASVGGPHPVGKITRLGFEGYGVKRAGSFSGKTTDNSNVVVIEFPPTISMRSGFRVSPSQLTREWTGLMVARSEADPRHPQEFVKGRVDRQSVPNPKPEATDVFLTT